MNGMAIEVFNRYENKYMLGEGVYLRLRDRLSEHMELDEHNKRRETYPIANLWYDTEDSALIRASLSKPKYKEKLRLRAYGAPGLDAKVYAEIKKKFAGLVNKRRAAMTLREAYDFLQGGNAPETGSAVNRQIVGELAYILQTRALRPAMHISCDRRAYFGIGDDVRVSFDENIRARHYDLRLESGAYGERLLDDGIRLMEIKTARSIPLWLCRLLSEYKIRPVGFSKYGFAYKQALERARRPRVYVFASKTPTEAGPSRDPAAGFAAAIAR
jgi:hypothetical protein